MSPTHPTHFSHTFLSAIHVWTCVVWHHGPENLVVGLVVGPGVVRQKHTHLLDLPADLALVARKFDLLV
jgi:hypothetical protein